MLKRGGCGPVRGRHAGLVLGRRGRAVVHAVGGLAGDRAARVGDRRDARGPRPARGAPDRGRGDARRARREDLRSGRRRRGRARGGAGIRGGRLRVASFPSAGSTLMPLAVAQFRGAHPDVELSLAEGEPEEIAPRLRAGEFDLALLFEFPGVRERAGRGSPAGDAARGPDARRAAGRPPARGQARATAADLRDEQWVQTSESSPCARHVVRLCSAAGFEPK